MNSRMTEMKSKDPMHGVTLEMIVNRLEQHFGWEELGRIIPVRCFNDNPSLKSSLTFLRKTPWARAKVERLYLATFHSRRAQSRQEKSRALAAPGTLNPRDRAPD